MTAIDDQLTKLLDDLKNAPSDDAAVFHRLVRECSATISTLGSDLARDLNMGRANFERWMAGRNAPHPAMRPVVYRMLVRCVERRVAELAEAADAASR